MLLSDGIENIKNIGEQRKEKLNGLGVYSVLDMLEYFPRDYEDRSVVTKIADITPNSSFGFVARLSDKPTLTIRGKIKLVRAKVHDGTGQIELVWFNQPYLKNSFDLNKEYWFFGKAEIISLVYLVIVKNGVLDSICYLTARNAVHALCHACGILLGRIVVYKAYHRTYTLGYGS